MDTTADSGDYLSALHFNMELDPDTIAYINALDFTWDDSTYDLSLSTSQKEPGSAISTQEACTSQNACEIFLYRSPNESMLDYGFNDGGESIVLNNFDSAPSYTPSPPMTGAYTWSTEATTPCISPILLQSQPATRETSSTPHIQGVESSSSSPSQSPKRKILPRPAESLPIHLETHNTHKRQTKVKRPKKRACDVAREQRKITKPILCPVCPDRFPFKKDLERHHVVRHKEYAASIGLYTGKFLCPFQGCSKTYTRFDNLTRHMKVHRWE